MVLLASMHIVIPRYFKWEKELAAASIITRQILYVHTFFIAFIVLLMGLLCIRHTGDLLHTSLGQQICLGLFLFWCTRLVFQFLVYSSQTWKGKRFETIMHVVFSGLWLYFSGVFLYSYLHGQ